VHRGGPEALRQLREAQRERVVALRQRFATLCRGVDQVGRIGQARLRCGQVGPFGFRDVERSEFASSRVEELALGGRGLRRMGGRSGLLERRAPGAKAFRDFTGQRREAAESVDKIALGQRLCERLMRVLAVQADEFFAQVLQVGQRGRPAIDPCPASSLRVEDTAQQDFVSIAGELMFGKPRAHIRNVGRVKGCGEFGAGSARAQLAQLEAIAQQQRERIEQNGLARARLAGKHG
jgi:hypothetical protein